MTPYLLKWFETIRISWSRALAYRLDFFLQVWAPPIVFLFIKINLWKTIFGHRSQSMIGEYDLDSMLTYHCWVMLTGLLTTSHYAMNLAEEIRLGKVSSYLIYPFQFWEFHTAAFMAYQGIQLLIFCTGIIFFILTGFFSVDMFLSNAGLQSVSNGLILSLMAGLFWFALQYFSGMLSFWLEETWMIRVVFIFIANFLSGAIVPLNLFPEIWTKILFWTPIPYLTFMPVKAFTGSEVDWIHAFQILLIYFLPLLGLNSWLFRRGVKLYSGSGI